jgi:hypothetical protein
MLPSLEERQHRTGMHLVDWGLDVMSGAVGAMPISTQLVLEISKSTLHIPAYLNMLRPP